MQQNTFFKGITFLNGKTINWGRRIEKLLKEWKPKKQIKGDSLSLIWCDVNFFGAILSARSNFFPEETLVKDRHLQEVILVGEIEPKKHVDVIKGINEVIGDPTGHLELANLSSHNWIHDDIEVSCYFMTNTNTLKVVIKK